MIPVMELLLGGCRVRDTQMEKYIDSANLSLSPSLRWQDLLLEQWLKVSTPGLDYLQPRNGLVLGAS